MTTTIAPLPHNNNHGNNGNGSSPGGDPPNNNEGLLNNNEGLLTLQEIAQRLDVGYGRLRGFAGADGIGELLGAVDVPGVKGVRYEPRAVEAFRRLIQAQDAKQVIPATATAWLEAHGPGNAQLSQHSNGVGGNGTGGDVVLAEDPDGRTPRGMAAILSSLAGLPAALRELTGFLRETRGMNETRQPALPNPPPPADRLLSAEDAAALLACSPRSVSRYVAPVLPRKWRESDCLRFIESLGTEAAKGDRATQ